MMRPVEHAFTPGEPKQGLAMRLRNFAMAMKQRVSQISISEGALRKDIVAMGGTKPVSSPWMPYQKTWWKKYEKVSAVLNVNFLALRNV